MFWLPPLVRGLTTALLVVGAATAAEVLGPLWGALIACLPVSAGPAYVFLLLAQGEAFVAASALGSVAANAATGLFLLAYGLLAHRLPPWRCLGAAVLIWLGASLAMSRLEWTPAGAVLVNLLVYGPGLLLLRPARVLVAPPALRARRWRDLALRAVAVACFVPMLVGASAILGPAATGIAAVFPVSLISLLAILRPRLGAAAAARLAAEALRAMLGFGGMLLVLHLAIGPWGAGPAFALAFAVQVLWSLGLLLAGRRQVPFGRGTDPT